MLGVKSAGQPLGRRVGFTITCLTGGKPKPCGFSSISCYDEVASQAGNCIGFPNSELG